MSGLTAGPLLVTFGSILEPRGGQQVRARLTAEIFADLASPMAIVTTVEATRQPPPWARTLDAPLREPASGVSLGMVRLIRRRARDASMVMVTNAGLVLGLALARTQIPLVWDTNECQSLHYRRLVATPTNRLKGAIWLGLERWAARRCAVAVAIGGVEAEAWVAAHPLLRDKLVVVDHAAIADARDPREARLSLVADHRLDAEGPILLFLGTMKAKQNIWAARWILDHLVEALPPEATVVLCGPGSEVLSQPRAPGRATVVGLGAVDDVESVVAAADVCLAPLAAGAGVKTKVLHYLAHGKRVVGTPVAFEGLAGAPGLFPSSLDRFATTLAEVVQHVEAPSAAEARACAQRTWLDEHHGRTHITQQWKKVLACLPS